MDESSASSAEGNPALQQPVRGDPPLVGSGTRIRNRIVASHMLFRANIRSGHAFLQNRRARRDLVRPRIRWVEFALASAMLVVLAAVVLDVPVGHYRGQWPPEVMQVARDLTDIGQSGWILIPTGVAILVACSLDWQVVGARRRIFAVKWISAIGFIFFSIAASGLITAIVKRFIGRARPVHFQELGAFSFHPFGDASFASFPSGHSTTIGGLFAAMALLFPRLRLPFLVLALWIAFTRVLVGAHYPSDVIAGLAWGAWFSYFSAMRFARYGLIFTYGPSGWPVRRSGYRPVRLKRFRRVVRWKRTPEIGAN